MFANSVYDHLYLKHSCPSNVKIADLNLATEYPYVKKIVMGNPENPAYDGVHLWGPESSRHFTYRAVQLIKSITGYTHAQNVNLKHKYSQHNGYDHTNCPQARYQRQQSAVRNIKRGQPTQYSYNIPVKNSFSVLGN